MKTRTDLSPLLIGSLVVARGSPLSDGFMGPVLFSDASDISRAERRYVLPKDVFVVVLNDGEFIKNNLKLLASDGSMWFSSAKHFIALPHEKDAEI